MDGPAPLLRRVLVLPDEDATRRFAADLAACLRAGDTLLLDGDLGAGKSTLARALIRARLSAPDLEVPSPTFTLVQIYGAGADEIWHADLYRLNGPEDAAELGLTDALGQAICLVEWPDRLQDLAPQDALTVALSDDGGGGRTLQLSGDAAWATRLGGRFSDA